MNTVQASQTPAAIIDMQHAQTLGHYTKEQQEAALYVFDTARTMLDTSGGSACGKLLLGLYNGERFPFDLTDLRVLDDGRYAAAMTVIDMDARRTWCEIHVLLNAILNVPSGKSTGHTLELWAHRLGLKGKCKKEFLPGLRERAV